ncbi:hypothetical protein CPB84DRAFT_1748159 [Gymnopilus junonius]|uniref:Alcohol dehydrogenase-like C-terminal domain-containing protein n=1 Tax=Gymnopilus junonius TaxID=109634 RepID=A0A9P5NKX1_GYMJU|nr:hypothetical protein CPB84DRAFT_1748159 [Gymnopilus junonius]
MRGPTRPASVKSYFPAFEIGKPITGPGVGVVIRSENSKVKPGDHVYSNAFGKSAFMAWREFSHAIQGETVFVSTGAGSVGSLVIQLAKMNGPKVIASAGSDEKVQFMKEIGADVTFNYKTTKTSAVLEKEGPIDAYWDNVGGETLDAALEAANNLVLVIKKSISMNGFIVFRLASKGDEEFSNTVPSIVASGQIKYREDVSNGLQTVGDVILAVQKGINKAKAVIHVADE